MARFEEYYDDRYDYRRRSSGTAKVGATLGGVGTGLGAVSLLGSLANGMLRNGNCAPCNEEIPLNRYDAQREHDYMMLQSENALLKAEKDSDRKDLEIFKFFNGKLDDINRVLAQQAIQNQKTADSFTILRGSLEAETAARCCADNTIVNYANNTFYAQEIADVKTQPNQSTTKRTYNPLPGECRGNGCNC